MSGWEKVETNQRKKEWKKIRALKKGRRDKYEEVKKERQKKKRKDEVGNGREKRRILG